MWWDVVSAICCSKIGHPDNSKSVGSALTMAVSDAVIERVVVALKADVTATLGAAHDSAVDDCVDRGLTFIDDDSRFMQWLVDEVQQYFHDTFVDTTWPACPRHPNHPMWFRDGAWWCGEERVTTLGALSGTSAAAEAQA